MCVSVPWLLRFAADIHEREVGKLKQELSVLRGRLSEGIAILAKDAASDPTAHAAAQDVASNPTAATLCPPTSAASMPPSTSRSKGSSVSADPPWPSLQRAQPASEHPCRAPCRAQSGEGEPRPGAKTRGGVEFSPKRLEDSPDPESTPPHAEIEMRQVMQQAELVKAIKAIVEKGVLADNTTGATSPAPLPRPCAPAPLRICFASADEGPSTVASSDKPIDGSVASPPAEVMYVPARAGAEATRASLMEYEDLFRPHSVKFPPCGPTAESLPRAPPESHRAVLDCGPTAPRPA